MSDLEAARKAVEAAEKRLRAEVEQRYQQTVADSYAILRDYVDALSARVLREEAPGK